MIFTTPAAGTEWYSKIFCRLAQRPRWTLAMLVLVALGPFLAKPFNIDDPLFIAAAHQIQAHPTDPYGFNVEWGFTQFPMWKVTENPPLACYYLALVAGVTGWGELALHTAFLLPVLAVVLGTHRLARHFCSHPLVATLAMLSMPVFLVSCLTVMCDLTMLAFWIWATVYWVEGTEQDALLKLFAAAGLIALAELTKYYGACLIPLLAAYSLASRRPVRRWAQCLLVPLAVLLLYQLATQALYGNSLLYSAIHYASFSKNLFGFSKAQSVLTALAFTGGCVAAVVVFAPLLWPPRTLIVLFCAIVVFAAIVFSNEMFWKNYGAIPGAARVHVELQMLVWATGGLAVLLLAVADGWPQRDPRSVLLALWVLGTFAFVAFLNWTVNGRSVLPMVPAAGILIVRRLELRGVFNNGTRERFIGPCLALGLILSWGLVQADYLLAVAVRQDARAVCADYHPRAGTLWFQGHWGFQYYMAEGGGSPLDFAHSELKPGDALAIPSNNTNFHQPNPQLFDPADIYNAPGPWLLTAGNQALGAGFYSSILGPLPFALGRVPPEAVSVYLVKPPPPATPLKSK